MKIGKIIRIIPAVPKPIIIKNWPAPRPLQTPIIVPNWPIRKLAEIEK